MHASDNTNYSFKTTWHMEWHIVHIVIRYIIVFFEKVPSPISINPLSRGSRGRGQHQRGRRSSVSPRGNDRSTWLGQGCVKKSTASTKIYPFHGGETFLALCQSRMLVIERGGSSRKKGNRLIKDKGNVIPPAHQ